MTNKVRKILMKEVYTIQDVAEIVNKTTATIRSWENKKIIPKLKHKSDNGWKMYTRRDLEDLLEHILNHNWERQVIKNEKDLEFIIHYCRGFTKLSDYPYPMEDDPTDNAIKETTINNKDFIDIINI